MTENRWARVEDLFHQALEHPPEARAAFLEQACGGDQSLFREVESLLAHESEAGDTFVGVLPPRNFDHYRIEEKLGEGGMGVVYRAIDTKLGRRVAIKFLHDQIADGAARRRFQQEALLVSSLNHPHILTVHDIGESDGRQYLVTEYVDGGTLKDWVKQERNGWLQAVELMTGIAEAVLAAHDAGILHRDIKPGNILLSKEGYAKLADFGLARPTDAAPEDGAETRTRTGVLMGTPAYMSPEQASGQALDVRSDIFSFGVVLYELLAGRRPFVGTSDLDALQKVIHATPAPLDRQIPAALRGIVEKALEKDCDKRYQSMREMALDLGRLWRNTGAPSARPKPVRKTSVRWWPWAAGAAVAVLAGLAMWERAWPVATPENPLAGARFSRVTDFGGMEQIPAISPDGKFVAFVSDHDGTFDVWLSQAIDGTPQNLTKGKAGDVRGPVRDIGFAGDGSDIWIAGTQKRRLQVVPLIGGTLRQFLGADATEIAWSPDHKRLVYHSWELGDEMFLADGDGGNIRPLLAAGPADDHRHFPIWSQDGRWIFFVRGRPATREMDLWRISADGGQPERLTNLNTDIAFPTPIDARTLVYVAHDGQGAGPWLWSFDLETKTSRRCIQGFEQYTAVAATSDGRRLVASVVNSKVSLWTLPIVTGVATERDVRPFALPVGRALAPRFGGGGLFFMSSRDGADGLWSYRDGRLTEIWKGSDGALQSPPAISPDGHTIAILLTREQKRVWFLVGADGTRIRPLSQDVDPRGTACWSPDGKWIVSGGKDSKGEGLFKIPVDGGAPVRLQSGPALDPVWSPAGNLIVYGGANVFTNMPLEAVRPDGTRVDLPRIAVRREGERMRFLPDGSGLVYMLAEPTTQDFWLLELAGMKTRPLARLENSASMRTFDITPDGKQVIFDRAKESSDIVLIDLPGRSR